MVLPRVFRVGMLIRCSTFGTLLYTLCILMHSPLDTRAGLRPALSMRRAISLRGGGKERQKRAHEEILHSILPHSCLPEVLPPCISPALLDEVEEELSALNFSLRVNDCAAAFHVALSADGFLSKGKDASFTPSQYPALAQFVKTLSAAMHNASASPQTASHVSSPESAGVIIM